jgi:hypothetical protein
MLNFKKNKLGQAALATVILIGGLISLIALLLIIIISASTSSVYALQASQKALAIANAGADDALIQLVRNKNFSGSYNFYIGQDLASVTVTNNGTNPIIIDSTATVSSYKKRVRVLVSLDENGEVRIIKREQN